MPVEPNHQSRKTPQSHHDFAKAIPAFDKAMRKIVDVPKGEVDQREYAERAARAANK